MFEVVSFGKKPWGLATPAEIRKEVCAGYFLPQPAGCPHKLYRYMKRAWMYTPELPQSPRPAIGDMYSFILTYDDVKGPVLGLNGLEVLGGELKKIRVLSEKSHQRTSLCQFQDGRVIVKEIMSPGYREQFIRDLATRQALKHCNLVQLVAVNTRAKIPWAAFTYAGLGSLSDLVHNCTDEQLLNSAVDVAMAMEYLSHQRRFCSSDSTDSTL